MEFDLSNSATVEALTQFTETGADAGCPFCTGRMIASVAPNERIIMLKGMNAGRLATVSSQPGFSVDEFTVRFDSDPPGQLTRILPKLDAYVYFPINQIPDWMCNLSIDDLCSIDEAALKVAISLSAKARSVGQQTLYCRSSQPYDTADCR